MARAVSLRAVLAIGLVIAGTGAIRSQQAPLTRPSATLSQRERVLATHESAVVPILRETCAQCHNENLASGGVNLKPLERRESFSSYREQWETVLRKLKTGEMPPPAVQKPAGLASMMRVIESGLDRLDRNVKPDPGRVTARRLN